MGGGLAAPMNWSNHDLASHRLTSVLPVRHPFQRFNEVPPALGEGRGPSVDFLGRELAICSVV